MTDDTGIEAASDDDTDTPFDDLDTDDVGFDSDSDSDSDSDVGTDTDLGTDADVDTTFEGAISSPSASELSGEPGGFRCDTTAGDVQVLWVLGLVALWARRAWRPLCLAC